MEFGNLKTEQILSTYTDGYTTLGLTAEEIHEIGLSEVERIHGEIYEIMEKVNFDGTLKEFFDFMREDDQFYYPEDLKGDKCT